MMIIKIGGCRDMSSKTKKNRREVILLTGADNLHREQKNATENF